MLCEHLPSKMKGSYGKLRFQTFSTFLSSFRKKTLRLSHSDLTVSTLDSGREVWDRNLAASHSWTRHSYSRYLSPTEGMNRYRRIFKVSGRNAEGNLRWTSIPSRGSSCTLSRFMLHSPKQVPVPCGPLGSGSSVTFTFHLPCQTMTVDHFYGCHMTISYGTSVDSQRQNHIKILKEAITLVFFDTHLICGFSLRIIFKFLNVFQRAFPHCFSVFSILV